VSHLGVARLSGAPSDLAALQRINDSQPRRGIDGEKRYAALCGAVEPSMREAGLTWT